MTEPRAWYTGVGSRSTPPAMRVLMTRIARRMALDGLGLRSGAADGADRAFEDGADATQIYLPWRGFNGHRSARCTPSAAAMRMAQLHHPAWHRCSRAARLMHARNCHQVLGDDLMDRSTCLICWTPDGLDSGGTGQAIRIARAWRVQVFNLYHRADYHALCVHVYGKRRGDLA